MDLRPAIPSQTALVAQERNSLDSSASRGSPSREPRCCAVGIQSKPECRELVHVSVRGGIRAVFSQCAIKVHRKPNTCHVLYELVKQDLVGFHSDSL